MDEALSEWLKLRETVDAASRSESLTKAVVAPLEGEARVLDLATGAGSNLRYLLERLPPCQRWLAVDRSPLLLNHLVTRTVAWATGRGYEASLSTAGCIIRGKGVDCEIETRQVDLRSLEASPLFQGRNLVTGSALLDLVSASWLRTLARECEDVQASTLFTITYDGRSPCAPAEPEDALVLDLFNRHQRTDKGLGGVAAGPEATDSAVRAFEDAGYHVLVEQSDWTLGPADAELQRSLIQGWADAATEISPGDAAHIAGWLQRRLRHVDEGRSLVVVGHKDLAAIP